MLPVPACRLVGRRQDDHEAAAAALARLAADTAAMQRSDLLDQRQAQADTACLLRVAFDAIEGLKDLFTGIGRHPRAAIQHFEPDDRLHRRLRPAQLDSNRLFAATAVATGILQKVSQQASQQAAVAAQDHRSRGRERERGRGRGRTP